MNGKVLRFYGANKGQQLKIVFRMVCRFLGTSSDDRNLAIFMIVGTMQMGILFRALSHHRGVFGLTS